jgi:2-haloacid dehalogenase
MRGNFEPQRLKLLSFDVFGTLIRVREGSYGAFARILGSAGAPEVDVKAFWEAWEERNIAAYWGAYRPYKQICRQSLADTFEGFELYEDVEATLAELARHFRLAVVSNIDDDLLAVTPLKCSFDLVATAERAKGYKPDGTLFRHLLAQAGVPVDAILHAGQSQFTDMVGAKPLGLTVAWINRRGVALSPAVPKPDFQYPDIRSLLPLVLPVTPSRSHDGAAPR